MQPLDFFGDGTRIPLIVVSKYSKGGHISHTYSDHVSISKFIERNWALPAISNRSRDNLPDPVMNDQRLRAGQFAGARRPVGPVRLQRLIFLAPMTRLK